MPEHAAVNAEGQPYVPVGSFNFIVHDRWVAAGHCPVVSRAGMWCSKPAGHVEQAHGSPNVPPDERGPHWIEWLELSRRIQV